MGVFVTNSFEDRVNREKMEQMLVSAVQQGKAELSDAARVLNSNSMNYIQSALEAGEAKAFERQESANRQAQETEQMRIQAMQQKEQLDRQLQIELSDKETDRAVLIKKMDIAAQQGGDGGELEAMIKLDDARREDEKLELERTKEKNRSAEKQEELDIKREDIKVKKLGINKKPSGPK